MIGNAEAIIQYLFQQDREKVFEVREHKQKRSLTQNAYFWVLVNEIANVTRQSKDYIHLQMLKEYGQNQVISVQSNIDISKFVKYFEEIGHGRANGKDFTHYRVFEGSSEMDSREMAILLDGVVQEAEQLGIPTLTPAEIARLKP